MGKVNAMLFVLSYDDFKQLAATYVEDNSLVVEAVTESLSSEDFWGVKGGSARSDRCGRLAPAYTVPQTRSKPDTHRDG